MGTLCRESRVEVHLAMIWVMVVAKTMCHVVRKSAVTQSCQLRVFGSRSASCLSRGPGVSRSYGSLYDEDVLSAIAICGKLDQRQGVSQGRTGRRGGPLTEFCGCQNPFVKDDNTGAAGNPDTAPASISQHRNSPCARARYRRYSQRRPPRPTPLHRRGLPSVEALDLTRTYPM